MAVGVPGEVLIASLVPFSLTGPAWNGSPAPITVAVPNNPGLLDQALFVAGVMVGSAGSQVATGLTRAAGLGY